MIAVNTSVVIGIDIGKSESGEEFGCWVVIGLGRKQQVGPSVPKGHPYVATETPVGLEGVASLDDSGLLLLCLLGLELVIGVVLDHRLFLGDSGKRKKNNQQGGSYDFFHTVCFVAFSGRKIGIYA